MSADDELQAPGVSFIATAAAYLLFWLLLPFLLLHPKVRQGVRRRLGLYEGVALPQGGPRVWLHGASAGDVLGLVPIVRELKALHPEARIIISSITDSGAAMAQQKLAGLADLVTFLPYDLPGACRRTLAALRPDVLVLEYTELWPQLIDAAFNAGVKLALTNGRLRPRNLRRYRILFGFVGNLLMKFDVLMMRADEEAERALLLGAPRDRVQVTGNTKFDALAISVPATPDESLRTALGLGKERLWVCGSTHEGEEGALLKVFAALRRAHPDLRLLIAPRYIERAGRVLALARALGLDARLRSQTGWPAQVIVLDTIGELVRVYQLATMVFVGGSFGRRGGQNILEPAACGKPVLFGPRMENFADSVQVLVGRGGLQVKDPVALLQLMRDLLARPDEILKLGELAREAVSSVRGASLRDARLRSQTGWPAQVIVLDTIGELVRAYQLATLVFVGGSFGRRGGQNILEPAACGKLVLFGPRMENFADSVQVLVGRGGLQVKDPAALLQLMRDLLARPDEILKLGELAREAVSSVRGASARDARLIADLLP